MQPGLVRAIEYEVVPSNRAASIGLVADKVRQEVRAMSELGVLRCVDHQGRKLTVVGDARHVKKVVASGRASDPDGMRLSQQVFPVVMKGWKRTP
jgi:hypothetical protein